MANHFSTFSPSMAALNYHADCKILRRRSVNYRKEPQPSPFSLPASTRCKTKSLQLSPVEFALDTAELKGLKKSGCHKLAKALSLPGGSIHPCCRLNHGQNTSSTSEVRNVAETSMTTDQMNSDLPSPIQIPPGPTMAHPLQAPVAGRDDWSGSATGSTLEVPEMEA